MDTRKQDMENMLNLFCIFHLSLLLQKTREVSAEALAERPLLQVARTTVTSRNEPKE